MSMKTVAVAAAKGGCLKTTITSLLATRASKESLKVAMFDLNSDQGNLSQWWMLRGQPMNPCLIYDIENIPQDARELERDGYEWLLVDTPPLEMDLIEQSIAIADTVIIPVRTSMFDVTAIEPVTSMCRKHRKDFAFLLAAVDTRVKFNLLTAQTIETLEHEGGKILDARVSYAAPYIQAITIGKTGAEVSKPLTAEVDALWLEVKAMAEAARANSEATSRRRANV